MFRARASSLPRLTSLHIQKKKTRILGRLGGSVGWASDFGSGHDLTVCEFEPCIGLCADSLEPGACSGSVSPSLSAPPQLMHALCLCQK